ncbi:MAG: hypothetical protein U1E86_07635 [Burkholderiaceae bacterium]
MAELEKVAPAERRVLIVRWIAGRDEVAHGLRRLRCGERTWTRRDDETEQEFRERAIGQAEPSATGFVTLWGDYGAVP